MRIQGLKISSYYPLLDLAVANTGSDSVSVLLGNGDETFQLSVHCDRVRVEFIFV